MFSERRQRMMEQMGEGVAIIPANREVRRINDTNFPFRQANNFHYLTGFPEPDAVALLMPKHPKHRFVLFVRPRDKDREIWDGRRFGPEGAKEHFDADATFDLTKIDEVLPTYLENQRVVHYAFGHDEAFDGRVHRWVRTVRGKGRKGVQAPTVFIDPMEILGEMRLVKDAGCLDAMRRAGRLSVEAHRRGMAVTTPGMNEAQLQAEMEHVCRMGGSPAQAYTSIVAGGDNANILHYVENNQPLNDGDLVLVDLGAEVDQYAGDITRTWPVNGRFTPAQKKVYDAVLRAQEAAFAVAKPGSTIRNLHEASCLSLAQSLVEWGCLKGDAKAHVDFLLDESMTEAEKLKKNPFGEDAPILKDFFMHGTSHWIGMDVHDCGVYRRGNDWRVLEPGVCFTVEPGLYFAKDNPKAPAELRGIGVRIEDDLLITGGGYENLTDGLPRTTDEVEACCRGE